MLPWLVQWMPPAIFAATFVTTALVVKRRQMPIWNLYERFTKAFPYLFTGAWNFLVFAFSGVGALLVPVVTGERAPCSFATCIALGVLNAILFPIWGAVNRPPPEPEDWLLWEKQEAESH
jgi:hypothetical protein